MTVTISIYEPRKAQKVIEKLTTSRLENIVRLLTRANNGDKAIPAMIEQIEKEIAKRKA